MKSQLLNEAYIFIHQCYEELNKSEDDLKNRLSEVNQQILLSGTYKHTSEELEYGAKVAWRNSVRCIGRLFWDSLHVIDQRQLDTHEQIYNVLVKHIEYATNKGKVRPTITVFSPNNVRVWNHQLIRYAGYETDEGNMGDPDSIQFTKKCIELGWEPKYGRFDVLPLVIELNGETKLFELPDEIILEVNIQPPTIKSFDELKLKWYAVPIISNMSLEIGGITYSAAPFNGWYMGTEIGARNLADDFRYNLLPEIADAMELDTSNRSMLWRDRALLELNTAVLHSFKASGVTIVDHHTAAEQFKRFEQKEKRIGRPITGKWSWLIPPLTPAATHIFHNQYDEQELTPNYFYQKKPF
ncbi:nitric oxide synthase oxygenase [Filobacillus milosensis]|uniref:nitric oxide synthase oxygenase n=1 Tax=Filobacillus milosensis TaxID=94137 RepID=UPI002B2658FF|nr:nitric oxide synthase oxygenase [Filobacillus milosensis]